MFSRFSLLAALYKLMRFGKSALAKRLPVLANGAAA